MTLSGTTAHIRMLLHDFVFPLLLIVVMLKIFVYALAVPRFGVVVDEDRIIIHDFSSHLKFAKAFWRGNGGYGVDDHLRMTEQLAGQRLPYALPFGYSPTMLWILAPLCPLPIAWGFFVWTVLGVAAVLWVAWRYRSLAVAASFLSPVALGCWGLGQTAILSTAALIALMSWDVAARRARASEYAVLPGVAVLWALTAKPPLAIAAATALLACRRLKVVAGAFALSIVSTALLLPLLGKTGLAEYTSMLRRYDLDRAASAFAWSLVPDTMGNVRGLLHVTLGASDAAAAWWSSVLWLVASTSIVAAAARSSVATEVRWGLAILSYLVFCPHVSWTEEIGLVLVLAAVTSDDAPPGWIRATIVGLILVMLLLLPGILFRGGARLPAVVAGKALIGGLLWAQWRYRPGQ